MKLSGSICALAFLLACHNLGYAQKAAKPNVIFILADDLGYNDLGCYGQKRIKTPRLDQLAAEGTRFTQFYSGSAVCAPARAALMTAQHMGHNTMRGNGDPNGLPATPESWPRLMKSAGYKTGMFGKWGIGAPGKPGSPLNQGFDEFTGFISQTAAHQHYPKKLVRGDDEFDVPEGTYACDLFTTESLSFIRRNKDNPFFLYIPYTLPHMRMEVPALGQYAAENWPAHEIAKAAMITRMDAQIGQIVDELKALELDRKTIIFFSSDNGPHKEGVDPEFFDSNGALRGVKRDLYEGGIRVPLIAWGPGQIKQGVSDQVWAFWDVLPTALDLAGAPMPEGRDGVSMKQALVDGRPIKHAPLYWEFYEGGFTQAVRKDDWKLVKTTTGSLELYDLARDVSETNNLAEMRPEVLMDLMPLLSSMRTDNEVWNVAGVRERVEKKAAKRKQQNKGREK